MIYTWLYLESQVKVTKSYSLHPKLFLVKIILILESYISYVCAQLGNMFTDKQNKRQKSQLTHAFLSKDCVSDLLEKSVL